MIGIEMRSLTISVRFNRHLIAYCVLAGISGSAQAFSVALHMDTIAETAHDSYNSGTLANQLSVTKSLSTVLSGASATGNDTVAIGSLHATMAGSGGKGDSLAGGLFLDEVGVLGPASSNPVSVRWTWDVTGTASALGVNSRNFSFFSLTSNSVIGNVGSRFDITIVNGTVVSFGYQGGIATFVASYQVGQVYDLFGQFDAQVGNTASFSTGSATLNFGNSAHAYAEVLTPGYTLSSASGHNYAPVPEPAIWATALPLLALRRRKRASQ